MWNPMRSGAPERLFVVASACALGFAVSGCASEYSLMKAPDVAFVPAGTSCSFEVSRGLPAAVDYVEIGRLEAQFFPAADLEKLRATVHDEVCSIGGELVVGEWDGDRFMSAVVFRRRPVSLSAPASTARPVATSKAPESSQPSSSPMALPKASSAPAASSSAPPAPSAPPASMP